MKKLNKFGILAASLIAAVSLTSSVVAFAKTEIKAPKGFGEPITVDVSATNEALNHWQYYISGTPDATGVERGNEDQYYEDQNVHFRATENGRTGKAMWIDKDTEKGRIVAYSYAVDILPNQNYAISAWVKNNCEEDGDNAISFMVKELNEKGENISGNGEFTVLSSAAGRIENWKKVEFPFTSSATGSKIVLKIQFDGKGDFYVDDIAVQTSTVSLPTVSYRMMGIGKKSEGASDELSNADLPDKIAIKSMSALTSANISSDSFDGDGASLLLNDDEMFKTNFAALSPDKTYRFSFKYKFLEVGSENRLSIRFNYNLTDTTLDAEKRRKYYIDVFNGSATEWMTCSVDLNGVDGYGSQGLAITAYAKYLIDELSLVCLDEEDPMQYIANGSFSGAYTAGYILGDNTNVARQADGTGVFMVGNGVYDNELFGARGYLSYAPTGLTAGQKYTLSYDYRFSGASWVNCVAVYHGGSEIKHIEKEELPNSWENATYEFTATGNDEFKFYGPSYYFWTTYYRNIEITDASGNQLNPNVDLVTPEPELGNNVFPDGTFEGDVNYVSEDWTFTGDANIYGLVFDTRYENIGMDTKPDWKICLNGTKEVPASATSKEIAVSKRTLAVALTTYNGEYKNLVISALVGDEEIFADENGFIELPENVEKIKLKFTSEAYVAFKKISLVSHTHSTPTAEEITTIEATCTRAGGKTFVCKDCEKTIYLEKAAMLAHDLEHVHVDATCKDGVDKDVCKMCKQEFNVKVLPGNEDNHKWVEKILKKPTCTEKGMKQNVCEICNTTKGAQMVSATGHTYENGTCKECGAKDPDYREPTSEKPTDSGTDSGEKPASSGCGSNVYGGFAALGMLAAAAFVMIKRKEK